MGMRAIIMCDSVDEFQAAIESWMGAEETRVPIDVRRYPKSTEGIKYLHSIPHPSGTLELIAIVKMNLEIRCDEIITRPTKRTTTTIHRIVQLKTAIECPDWEKAGDAAFGLLRYLLMRFDGYLLTEERADSGIWESINREAALEGDVEKASELAKKNSEPVLDTTWKELFDHFGKLVYITDYHNYLGATLELIKERDRARKARRTSVFSGQGVKQHG